MCDDPSHSGKRPPKLFDLMRERLRLRHYSLRTEQSYLQWVKRYIYHHGKRHPSEMGKPEFWKAAAR